MSETNRETVTDSEDQNLEQQTSESEVEELTENEISRMTDEEFDDYYNNRRLPDNFVRDTKTETKEEDDEEEESEEEDAGSEGADHIDDEEEEEEEDSDIPSSTSSDKKEEAPKKEVKLGTEKEAKVEESVTDYEKAYKEALQPIKAIGKEIELKSIGELRQLASMGIDYTKKMQALKPMRKIVETLEQASINEKELNFLIDVSKGNKDAIKELLKRNSLDPIEMDLDDVKYTPSNHMVSDNEVEFRSVMDEIKQSPHMKKITEITTNIWDEESRKIVLSNPKLLHGLLEEVDMGRFDAIQKEVERERLFGNNRGKPDVELYVTILEQKAKEAESRVEKVTQAPPKAKPKDATVDKKKAAPLKGTAGSSAGKSYKPTDLLKMSDDEFDKLDLSKLL